MLFIKKNLGLNFQVFSRENIRPKLFSLLALPASFCLPFILAYYLEASAYIEYSKYVQYLLFLGVPLSSFSLHALRQDYKTSLFTNYRLFRITAILELVISLTGIATHITSNGKAVFLTLTLAGIAVATARQEACLSFLEKNQKVREQLYLKSSASILLLILIFAALFSRRVDSIQPILSITLLVKSLCASTAHFLTKRIKSYEYHPIERMHPFRKARIYGTHTISSFSSLLLISVSYVYFLNASNLADNERFGLALLFLTLPLATKLALLINIESINNTAKLICSQLHLTYDKRREIIKILVASIIASALISIMVSVLVIIAEYLKFPEIFDMQLIPIKVFLCFSIVFFESFAANLTGLLQRCGILNYSAQFLLAGAIINILIYAKAIRMDSPVEYLISLALCLISFSIAPNIFRAYSIYRKSCISSPCC